MTSLPHPQSVALGVQRAFDLVIFDCDGVLVDSESIAIRVDQRVLADLGWELGLDEIVERFVGKSEAHFVAETERHLGVRLDADWEEKYQHWYRTAFERDLAAGCCQRLKDASSAPRRLTAESRPRICSFMLRGRSVWNRPDAPWWRTASTESRRPGRPACMSSPLVGE